jgi:hypothetical protein
VVGATTESRKPVTGSLSFYQPVGPVDHWHGLAGKKMLAVAKKLPHAAHNEAVTPAAADERAVILEAYSRTVCR